MNKHPRVTLPVALLFLLFAGRGFAADPVPVLVRENINTFSEDPIKIKKLRDAVAVLRDRKFDNSISWFTQAGIHDIRANDPDLNKVPTSIQALFHQCHKTESLFFLWHRAYVAAVEKLIQDAVHDPTFRLPYWNWYADPSLPEAFRNEFLDPQHTQKNSLYIANRIATTTINVNKGDPIWTPEIIADYDSDDFESFQSQLDDNEHGMIHVFVGTPTNMGSIFYAARDPIFYLHHANIDRLLMVWLKKNPTHKPPVHFPGWIPSVYRFPIPPGSIGNSNPPVYTPSEQTLGLGSMEAMGYKYDNVDPPNVSTPPVPAAPPHLQVSAVASATPKEIKLMQFAAAQVPNKALEIAAGGTVDLTVEASQKERIKSLANMTPSPQRAGLSLVFENIQVKEPPAGLAGYRVFVNLPKETTAGESFRDHFVGTLSLFNLQHAQAHGPTTIKLRFSRTQGAPALEKSLKSEGEGAGKVSVSLVPVLAPGASAPSTPVLTIGQIRLEGTLP
jgi:hypothetical protein